MRQPTKAELDAEYRMVLRWIRCAGQTALFFPKDLDDPAFDEPESD